MSLRLRSLPIKCETPTKVKQPLPSLLNAKTISLRALAKIAGVSPATVSLALRESPKLMRKTTERIRKLAKEHGYRRNPKLARIMAETVNSRYAANGETIACIITRQSPSNWNPLREPFLAMSQRCADYGYHLEPFWPFQQGMSATRFNKILWSRGVAGLIICPPSYSLRRNGRLTLPIEWDRFSSVEIDDVMTDPPLNQVRHDHLSGIWLALQEMENLGYRRIGLCLIQDIEMSTHHRWTAGYLYWTHLKGHAGKINPLLCPSYNANQIRRWITRNRLDAVISPTNEALVQVRASGIKVPDDIGYAALDLAFEKSSKDEFSPLQSDFTFPPGEVAGIDQCRDEQFERAVDLLVTLIHGGKRGVPPHPIIWNSVEKWQYGTTCGAIPEKPIPTTNRAQTATFRGARAKAASF